MGPPPLSGMIVKWVITHMWIIDRIPTDSGGMALLYGRSVALIGSLERGVLAVRRAAFERIDD